MSEPQPDLTEYQKALVETVLNPNYKYKTLKEESFGEYFARRLRENKMIREMIEEAKKNWVLGVSVDKDTEEGC